VAPPAGTLRVGRYFLALLALVALLYSIVFFGSRQSPKLGIDLVGGTQVVFTAKTHSGAPPTRDSMNQARNILADRVNGTGVTQATVAIQGSDQLVVSIPGQNGNDLQKLGKAAVLNFRGVVAPAVPVTCSLNPKPTSSASNTASPSAGSTGSSGSSGSGTATPSATAPASTPAAAHSGAAAVDRPLTKPSPKNTPKKTPTSTPKSSPKPTPSGSASGSGTTTPSSTPTTSPSTTPPTTPTGPAKCSATSVKDAAAAGKFTVPLTDTDYDKLSPTDKQLLAAALASFNCKSAQNESDLPSHYYVACDTQRNAFLLGPVIVAGTQIDTATASEGNAQQGQFGWSVLLSLKGSGQASWADYTKAHNVNNAQNSPLPTGCSTDSTPCADYVAFTLDGNVISAPVNLTAINGQDTEITGQFTATSAKDLANQLKYGALPLSFTADTAESVSATLGTAQLKAGLLAGGIGLILVVIYSLIYYRALGLVTIASLLVSGALTYGALVMLSTQIGFTLSLAGIAGFIVAVGITADSFVVFFERLKDEVHEGRSVRVAVPRAWVRARRTILSADTVSFLAAAVLYYFTTADVRGFAFTLGLSTILDLVVVFLFTHPMVSILSRSATFGSARFTGLDSVRGNTPAPSEPVRRERRERPTPEPEVEQKYAGVAVMDKPSAAKRVEPVVDEPVAAEPVADEPLIDEPAADEPVEDASAPAAGDESADDEPPRRRTAPEPGSAAERAAQRRARLRGQRPDEKGRE
jgi:preprotein translocase subunit SecD